ncbi:MAG: Cell division protein ZapA [Clostridia bacterium 41_269]|nr:MAG: Cell division protein ZapA [Clostridia bacterium 41_269]
MADKASSDENKTRTKVLINGQEYIIKSTYPSKQVKEIAAYVDKKMLEIKNANPYLSPAKLAVLTALNITDEFFLLKEEYESLLKLIEEEKKK